MVRHWSSLLVTGVPAVVAGALVAARLGQPDSLVFDEIHYVPNAQGLLATGVADGPTVHPPVGTWLIAAGIAVVGDTPAGWRAGGVLAAAVTVAATVALVRRLTGDAVLAVAAGTLLATDGVFLVQARTAMLDIHLAAFVAVGAWLVVVDRQRPPAAGGRLRARWPLLLAGVVFGLATATKWSGALALAGAAALVVAREIATRRRTGRGRRDHLSRRVGTLTLALVVAPVMAYALAWTPWVAGGAAAEATDDACPGPDCEVSFGDRLDALGRHHAHLARFHTGLTGEHPYRAAATTWPVQTRPVVYYWETCDEAGRDRAGEPCAGMAPGEATEVVALGNLALWWGGLALLPVLFAGTVRRDGRSAVVVVFLLAQYLPWLAVGRPVFSFYAVPLVAFLAAGVAVAGANLDRALGRRSGTVAVLVVVAAALVLFVYFAPLWYGTPLPESSIRQRWWLPGWV